MVFQSHYCSKMPFPTHVFVSLNKEGSFSCPPQGVQGEDDSGSERLLSLKTGGGTLGWGSSYPVVYRAATSPLLGEENDVLLCFVVSEVFCIKQGWSTCSKMILWMKLPSTDFREVSFKTFSVKCLPVLISGTIMNEAASREQGGWAAVSWRLRFSQVGIIFLKWP